jgi:hypothetical protein
MFGKEGRKESIVAGKLLILFYYSLFFYFWVLHPVAYLSNWFFMTPSITTKFQYVNSI